MISKKKICCTCLCLTILLVTGCITSSAGEPPTISIIADRQTYTPLMSSTVGIGLTPSYPSTIDNSTVLFQWQTDYGYFLSWDSPDFQVINQNNSVITSDKKIYWSYSPGDMEIEKPPVHVSLAMIDRKSGTVLNVTDIEIHWKDRSVARVLNKTG